MLLRFVADCGTHSWTARCLLAHARTRIQHRPPSRCKTSYREKILKRGGGVAPASASEAPVSSVGSALAPEDLTSGLETPNARVHVPVFLKEAVHFLLGHVAPLQRTGDPRAAPSSAACTEHAPMVLVDGTFGAGGHSFALLQAAGKLGRAAHVYAMDQDPHAIALARAMATKLAGEPSPSRLTPVLGRFSQMKFLLRELGVEPGAVDGVLLDIGVCSAQIDSKDRGFSFLRDGPLDMRMSTDLAVAGVPGPRPVLLPNEIPTAAQVLASISETELASVLRIYGEEKYSRKIARAIVQERQRQPIASTLQLAEIVRSAWLGPHDYKLWQEYFRGVQAYLAASPSAAALLEDEPADHGEGLGLAPPGVAASGVLSPGPFRVNGKIVKDPARRTFQALRMFVNDELSELQHGLHAAVELLRPGGRLVVLTFHPLEGKVLKRFLQGEDGSGRGASAAAADGSRSRRSTLHEEFLLSSLGEHGLPAPRDVHCSPPLRVLTKGGLGVSAEEVARNRRSRSATLFAFEKGC